MSNLLKDNKELMKQWDYKKNRKYDLNKITVSNHNKAWWICPKGHSYEQAIHSKSKGIGCPVCSNKLVLKGYNDLATTNPELINEWDYDKNSINNVTPFNVTKGAEKKIWWICAKCNQSYECFAYAKKANVGCPYCSSKIIKKGLNDIFTKNPKLKKYWDYEKNSINPYTIGICSHQKVFLICEKCGKSYLRALSKVKEDILCTKCSIENGAIKRIGKSNFGSKKDVSKYYPEILEYWDYSKNKNINPDELYISGSNKVWWLCESGHSFKSTISAMINGKQCPLCISESRMSFPEKAIVYYLQKNDVKVKENFIFNDHSGKELDVYAPDYKIAIEYDGKNWHRNKKRDLDKNKLCEENNITLLRIREDGLPKLDDYSMDYYYTPDSKYINLSNIIKKILMIHFNILDNNIDINRDRINIYELLYRSKKENSLINKYPEIAKEWNYEKNGKIKPENVYSKSGRKFWWICKKGHEWEATISHRVVDKTACPYCSNQKKLEGYNDLSTTNPGILKEWNYKKNNDLGIFPETMSIGTHKKVWWICEKGHDYECSIVNKSKGRGCPYCSGRKVLKGFNDLETTNPEVLLLWDYKRNTSISINDFSKGSDHKVWWICPKCNNNWQQRISHITNGIGCPKCYYSPYKNKE